jgi:hypothetical protein
VLRREAAQHVRKVFHGPLTYASVPFEVVDWGLLDFIGVDLYRNSKNEDRYPETIRCYLGQASRWSTPNPGRALTGGTGLVAWSSAR